MGADEAWAIANEAARASGVELRTLSTDEDLQGVGSVIETVWGPEAMPPALLRAFRHAGGVLVGAFVGREQIGFVLGFLGWEDGLHLHSHMLAVLPEQQSRGVGRALKLAQRARASIGGSGGPVDLRSAPRWQRAVQPERARGRRDRLPPRLLRRDARPLEPRGAERPVRGPLGPRIGQRAAGAEGRIAPSPSISRRSSTLRRPEAPEPVATDALLGAGCTVAIPAHHLALRTRDPELSIRWRDAVAGRLSVASPRASSPLGRPQGAQYVFEPARELP